MGPPVWRRERYTAENYGLIMPPECSIKIDSLRDLLFAQFVIDADYFDMLYWKQAEHARHADLQCQCGDARGRIPWRNGEVR